jgi:transcription antitermination factor NusG
MPKSSLARSTTPEVMPHGWYAAYTRHQHEKSASQMLEQKGLEVLLPLYRVAHRWKDRAVVVHLPLFPCYLFVRASLDTRAHILRTPGIVQLVGTTGAPVQIPDAQIEGVRSVVRGPAPFEPHPYLHCGDRVVVLAGPLAGVEGILSRFKTNYRVVLSIDLLRQSVAVELDLSLVERVSKPRDVLSASLTTAKCPA